MYFSKENNDENVSTHYIKVVNSLRYAEYDNMWDNNSCNIT